MPKLPTFLKMEPIRYRAFLVTYSPPTNDRSAKIRIRDLWHKKTIIISWEYYTQGDMLEKATKYLSALGIEIAGMTATRSNQYDTLLCTTFEKDISHANREYVKACKAAKSQRILQNGHTWSSKDLPNMQSQANWDDKNKQHQ